MWLEQASKHQHVCPRICAAPHMLNSAKRSIAHHHSCTWHGLSNLAPGRQHAQRAVPQPHSCVAQAWPSVLAFECITVTATYICRGAGPASGPSLCDQESNDCYVTGFQACHHNKQEQQSGWPAHTVFRLMPIELDQRRHKAGSQGHEHSFSVDKSHLQQPRATKYPGQGAASPFREQHSTAWHSSTAHQAACDLQHRALQHGKAGG